jgi:cytoskeletal protein CcmA (bactofilin family)
MDGNLTTLIDTQADVEGNLKGKDAHILGRFKGDVTLSGRVLIGESSRVEAKVTADSAEIAGEFKGEVKARSVTLTEKARVQGSVEAQILIVRDGAQLNGAVSSGGAAKPRPTASGPAPGAVTG